MSFDQTIVYYGAPALCGIKPACLFSMQEKRFVSGCRKINGWNQLLSNEDCHILTVHRLDQYFLFFVYSKNSLVLLFEDEKVKKYLQGKGYRVDGGFDIFFDEMLDRLECAEKFPHEVGLFLGYPLEDVILFEQNEGQQYKFGGYWKVYGDVRFARRKLWEYRKCSKKCSEFFSLGMDIPSLVRRYRTDRFICNGNCSYKNG